jgi:hypothetical protein
MGFGRLGVRQGEKARKRDRAARPTMHAETTGRVLQLYSPATAKRTRITAHAYVIDDDALATKHEPKLPSVPRRERFLPSVALRMPTARQLWAAPSASPSPSERTRTMYTKTRARFGAHASADAHPRSEAQEHTRPRAPPLAHGKRGRHRRVSGA